MKKWYSRYWYAPVTAEEVKYTLITVTFLAIIIAVPLVVGALQVV